MKEFPWLCYSAKLDGVFCLPCVLFGCHFLDLSKINSQRKLINLPIFIWHKAKSYFSLHRLIELLQFCIRAGDKVLAEHMEKSARNATYISKTSQNKLIKCCGDVITDELITAIRKAEYYSILADEVSDVSNKEQLSLVIRFFDSLM